MEATSASAGWVQASWWRRSNSAAFKDVNRFPSFSENWKQCIHLSRRLLNGGRRHKVGYARVATFQRNSGHFPVPAGLLLVAYSPSKNDSLVLAAVDHDSDSPADRDYGKSMRP